MENASIPIVSHTRVLKLLRTFHEKFRNLMKPYKERKSEMKYIDKLSNFETKCREKLFDIASCKCVLETCKCTKADKVPKEEQGFLRDQRTIRMMIIAGTDTRTSTKLRQRRERQLNENYNRARRQLHLTSNKQDKVDNNSDQSCETEGVEDSISSGTSEDDKRMDVSD